MTMKTSTHRGFMMLLVIVFGAVFFVTLAGLSGFLLSESHADDEQRLKAEAVGIAEAGVDYYRWHLAHFPNDFKNGGTGSGPYQIPISDPESGTAGTASLTISANSSCGQTTSIDITATGTPADGNVSQAVSVRYARPSVAAYSYIVNASVWAGADRVINGPYHSNGGIRMDGTANAPVTSSVNSWSCTADFGCTRTTTEPGVFGAGTNSDLWSYPTPQVDFAGIAADFSSLKSAAQSSGIYLPRYSSGNSRNSSYYRGYHLIFNADGTVTVKKVSSASGSSEIPIDGSTSNVTTDYAKIGSESTYKTYTLPSDCGLIFVEDNTWVEGTIPSKVTLVVANVTTTGVVPEAYLHGNIQYASTDGSDGFTLMAQHDVLIAPDSPQDMTLDGVFVAQSGAFGRNLYTNSWGTSCNRSYEPRGTLTILGTTVSNLRTGTQWSGISCNGGDTAGYQSRIDAFDRTLSTDPPPFTPTMSTDYQFVDWKQE
jgi:hypothetical protein